MNQLIKLTILIWQWCAVVSNPTMIESFPLRTRENSSINTKLPSTDSWSPSIANNAGQQIAQTTVAPIYNTIKLTHEDVVKGSNSVYGSQFSNGGMIFSINGKSATTNPLISAAPQQPVLMQYLSPDGLQQTAAVQYIQLIRPVLMVPAQPYLPAKPNSEIHKQTTSEPTASASVYSYHNFNRNQQEVASYSTPVAQYFQSNPQQENSQISFNGLDLNTNEFVSSASSPVISSVAAPQAQTLSSPYVYRPSAVKYQTRAQRA